MLKKMPSVLAPISSLLVAGLFMNSCITRTATSYFDATCDKNTNVHQFLAEIATELSVDEVHIRIFSLADNGPAEEEHILVFKEIFIQDVNQKRQETERWILELAYDGVNSVANQTTLFDCSTPRVVEFEAIYDENTSVEAVEIVFMDQS